MLGRTDHSEKRDYIRMEVDCDVVYRTEDGSTEKQGKGKNLSATGVLFESDENFPAGTRLVLKVMPRNTITPPLDMTVEVVRVDEVGPGQYMVACQAA
ncbi:MAG: PilZ domain-containing protein [Gammaproteobacteria bacterium]|nr:PilZ domain-containing protein [Gammaproteobacteria bacterium]